MSFNLAQPVCPIILISNRKPTITIISSNCFITRVRAVVSVLVGPCYPALLNCIWCRCAYCCIIGQIKWWWWWWWWIACNTMASFAGGASWWAVIGCRCHVTRSRGRTSTRRRGDYSPAPGTSSITWFSGPSIMYFFLFSAHTHTHTHTRLTALFQDYPGEPVPER